MNIYIILLRLAFGLIFALFILSKISIFKHINLSKDHHKEFVAQRKIYIDDHRAHDGFA